MTDVFGVNRFSPLSTIPQILHTHLFIHYRCCIILATDSFVARPLLKYTYRECSVGRSSLSLCVFHIISF